jgi:hypothetical protein
MPTRAARENAKRQLAEKFANVFTTGGYSDSEIDYILRRYADGINEAEWRKLKKAFDLPDDARANVDHCIAGYWKFRADHSVSPTLERRLNDTLAHVQLTGKKLTEICVDRDFFKGIFAYYEPSPSQQADTLTETLDGLLQVERLLQQALNRIKNPKKRPTHRAVFLGVAIMEGHLRFLGRNIEESKDLVFNILQLADPKLEKRQVSSVLKQYCAHIRPNFIGSAKWLGELIE